MWSEPDVVNLIYDERQQNRKSFPYATTNSYGRSSDHPGFSRGIFFCNVRDVPLPAILNCRVDNHDSGASRESDVHFDRAGKAITFFNPSIKIENKQSSSSKTSPHNPMLQRRTFNTNHFSANAAIKSMRMIILFCCTLLLISINSFGQNGKGRIDGIVHTTDNRSIEGATVQLIGTRYFTVSDRNGKFQLTNIPQGIYNVHITYLKYEKDVNRVKVLSDNIAELSVEIPLQSRQLDEVVVTGQYLPQSMKNSVYNIRVIDSGAIAARAAINIEQILVTEAGIRFSFDPALGESNISLNGISGQNIKILLDGVPLIERGASRNSLNQIDVSSIERIEIVEGPLSVIYGTDALGGVINIITRHGRSEQGLYVTAQVQEESAGKEYDFMRDRGVHNERIGLQYNAGHWFMEGSIARNNFGGWQGDTTGRANEWLPKDQWLGSARLGYHNQSLNIWNRFNYLKEDLYSRGSVFNDIAADQTFITHRYTDQLEANWRPGNKWSINSTASFQHLERRTLSTIFTQSTGQVHLNPDPSASQDMAKFDNVFFRSLANWYLSDKVTLQPGIEVLWDRGSGDRIEGRPTITNYAFFVTSEIKPAKWVNIRPGLRFLHNTVYDAPIAVPSLNTKFNLSPNLDFRASYGYGYRAPSLNELFFVFHDANHNIVGNPDLKAEHSHTLNGSFAWHSSTDRKEKINVTLSGFYSQFNDKIDLATSAANSTVNTYINIAESKATGLHLDGNYALKRWNATAGIAYIGHYNRYSKEAPVAGTEDNTFAWAPEINGSILYLIPGIETTAGVFYKFTGKLPVYLIDDDDNVYLARQGSYNNLEFSLSKKAGKFISFRAGVKNIFNVTKISNTVRGSSGAHASGGGPVLQNYGRSWFIGIIFNSPRIL